MWIFSIAWLTLKHGSYLAWCVAALRDASLLNERVSEGTGGIQVSATCGWLGGLLSICRSQFFVVLMPVPFTGFGVSQQFWLALKMPRRKKRLSQDHRIITLNTQCAPELCTNILHTRAFLWMRVDAPDMPQYAEVAMFVKASGPLQTYRFPECTVAY